MSRLLYIQASPRGERSYSLAVANAFVGAYRNFHPESEIVKINVFEKDLPLFDGLAVKARYTILHGLDHTPQERGAWKAVEAVIDEFKSADKYVMAVPMWNFLIPYRLKHYLDVLIQPTYTFSFSPEAGYRGLVTGKPIFLACARGGEYPPGSRSEAYDVQSRYLKMIFEFIGFTDIRTLVIEPTLAGGADMAGTIREQAIARAREMAAQF
ncbi:MAG: NAD(P)H-dependent oxidoreductase [Desulfobacterales bacterium]|nr:NAD(P)H-dependent oxidoreductase [Desulfobacterales bacterium]MDD4073516.1 NAD(P)H-dependent oxidoreductase [Desulfobacterales bacterium]MDD4393147.1 NAD(P)H-dependent oxidoreductase [Desulfobacterales bacterium]